MASVDQADFEQVVVENGGKVPVSWVCSRLDHPFPNLGDALGPIVVGALSGLPVQYLPFKSPLGRLCSIGTVLHMMSGGTIHVWGSGVDPKRNAMVRGEDEFRAPPDTNFVVHAVRGPFSRNALSRAGIDTPGIYGDPAWYMPWLIQPHGEKIYELGVVLHVSETIRRHPEAPPFPEFTRYQIAEDESAAIKIIATYHEPNLAGLHAKLSEILACRRIVSTSFHGMMLADAYGIPCAFFSLERGGGTMLDAFDDRERLDHRFADFYAGSGRRAVPTYRQDRGTPTDWADVMSFIDRCWQPVDNEFTDLLGAFPLALAVDPANGDWSKGLNAFETFTL